MRRFATLILTVTLAAAGMQTAAAAPTAEQRQQVKTVKVALRKAGNLYNQRRLRGAVDVVEQVQQQVDTLAENGNQDMLLLLKLKVGTCRGVVSRSAPRN